MPIRSRNHANNPKLQRALGLSPTALMPDVALLANAENEATGEATEIYVFKKHDGSFGSAAIPRDQSLFDDRSIARIIALKNGVLPRDLGKARKLVRKASCAEPREQWRYVKQDGWRRDMKAFVHRGRVYGRKHVKSVELKAPLSDRTRNYPLQTRGNLEDWKGIERLAYYSTRLRLTLSAAFAAPLLRVIDRQPFIIVLAGRSKAGKSTSLLGAASVIGIGREAGLPNFNATPASLQETAAEFNDRLLPVNEIGLLKGSKRDFFHNLRTLTYRFAEGRDTSRHSKSQYAGDAGILEWLSIMIVSSETTLEALAELAGEKRDEGEYARAFDVPATTPGHTTIFDRFPKKVGVNQREAWARRKLVLIRDIASKNYGLAFGPYISALISDRDIVKLEVQKAMKYFLESLEGVEISGALHHAAQNFGVIYAGAVLAKNAGLVSWNLDRTRSDLKDCFMDGVQEITRVHGTERRAESIILHQIGGLRALTEETDAKAVEGWFEDLPRGRLYAVKTPFFEKWFTGPEEERAALRWLHDKQLLKLKDGAKPDFPNMEWASTSPKVEGKGYRCYRFWDPRTPRVIRGSTAE